MNRARLGVLLREWCLQNGNQKCCLDLRDSRNITILAFPRKHERYRTSFS